MLILSRKCDEKIHIGRDITITVNEKNIGSRRLAIDAPLDVAVHRHEVYEKIYGPKNEEKDNVEG